MRNVPDFDEVERLLGLSPETKKIKGRPRVEKYNDIPLIDRVQAMTFGDKVAGTQLNDASKRLLHSYRIKLRQAERFVLDDDAVKLVCHLCHEIKRLAAWSFLARIPYPVFWVDFNLHTKVKEFEVMNTLGEGFKFNPDHISPTIGYLFYKDGYSDTRWIAHEFKELGGEPIPGMIAFLFDPEGDVAHPIRGSETWNSPTLRMRPGFPKIPLNIVDTSGSDLMIQTLVDPEFGLCGVVETEKTYSLPMDQEGAVDATDILTAPGWFAARSGAIVDPFWERHYIHDPEMLNRLIALEASEQSGIMRWLVTFLASLNALPRAVRPINTRVGTHMAPGATRPLPYMRHNNLTIDIPRDNRIIWARRHLDQQSTGRRLAWHPVIGHWRVIEYGKARGRMCVHEPVMVESGMGICQNCEMLVRWIEVPNGRGDPELGIVDHTTKIHGRKR